jgi:hypothetical protein
LRAVWHEGSSPPCLRKERGDKGGATGEGSELQSLPADLGLSLATRARLFDKAQGRLWDAPASSVFQNSVQIEVAIAIKRERVAMAIAEEPDTRERARDSMQADSFGVESGKGRSFPQARFGHSTLTEEIHSYRIGAKYGPLCSMGRNDEPGSG